MFCKNCGKEIKDNARFCSGCGVSTDAGAQMASGVQTQPSAQNVQPPGSPAGVVPPVPPQQQYQAPPVQPQYGQTTAPKKKSMKPLFGLGGAAAAVLVFFIAIFPMIGNSPATGSLNVEVNAGGPTGGRDAGFNVGDCDFTTNDPRIEMIEVNQGLSYGFDSNTGEFYLMDNFIAGKETAVFIALNEPLNPKSEVRLIVERDGQEIATLSSVEMIDDSTLLFHPRDISEAGYWETGAYTFTFEMDDSVAVRKTNFYESMPIKLLAVPMVNNYSGTIKKCEGDWKLGATLVTANYPVARDEVEYVLGPELDLSDPKYDLNTDDGAKAVWEALCSLQTPGGEYTMILGFMRTPTDKGILGYTYGAPGNIVCESEKDLLATVTHEIAHCYKIGDEYNGGSLNDILNPPPYGTNGHDILTRESVTGSKEHVKSGREISGVGTGAAIYEEQRVYWTEGRQLLGSQASWMGAGEQADSLNYWATSDIYNHLFKVFTGQLTGNEPGYGTPAGGADAGGDNWGQCPKCFEDVYDPALLIECKSCGEYVLITGKEFSCGECGAGYNVDDITDNDLWLYHAVCKYALYYPVFVEHNGGSGRIADSKTSDDSPDDVMVLEIVGDVYTDDTFTPSFWYSYETPVSALSNVMEGEYSAVLYDTKGKQVSVTYFDAEDHSHILTKEGRTSLEDAKRLPIRILVRFPDGAARIEIKNGNKVIYSQDVSKNTPSVKFTGLSEGQDIPNKTTLTWEASDADGDEITYQIWYVRTAKLKYDPVTGEEFPIDEDVYIEEEFLVATNKTGTSLNVDLSDYPGTDRGWFRILASDGAKTGVSESPKVVVPYKAPDILNVDTGVTKVKLTDMIEIQAKAYDAQDGWLWIDEFEWLVDGEPWYGDIGDFHMYSVPYLLAPGMHTITCKVTNSGGLSDSRDFVYEVLEDESDLPDDWSRNDVSLALRFGFYLPLDRLDSPVTRIEFAKMMFSLGACVLPDDAEDLPLPEENAEFTDMSNDLNDMDYVYAMYMVGMGLMDAPDGKFNPHGSLTEREAMQIFYKEIEQSRSLTNTTYSVLDESEFIPELTEWGLFDEPGGPAEYQPREKLSKKMLMSRIARFLKYEFEMDDLFYGWGVLTTDGQ